MDILVQAGINNKYFIHNRNYSVLTHKEFNFQLAQGEYMQRIAKLFSDLKQIIRLASDNKTIDMHIEIILEMFLSFEHISVSLHSDESLIQCLPLIRLFMDNIVRYYSFDSNRNVEIDVYSFDMKKTKDFTKSINYESIFGTEFMQEYYFSGAENHFGSLFNRNLTVQHTLERKQYILNILKILIRDTVSLMADIVVKIAKHTNKKMLAMFEQILLINIEIGLRILEMENHDT